MPTLKQFKLHWIKVTLLELTRLPEQKSEWNRTHSSICGLTQTWSHVSTHLKHVWRYSQFESCKDKLWSGWPPCNLQNQTIISSLSTFLTPLFSSPLSFLCLPYQVEFADFAPHLCPLMEFLLPISWGYTLPLESPSYPGGLKEISQRPKSRGTLVFYTITNLHFC